MWMTTTRPTIERSGSVSDIFCWPQQFGSAPVTVPSASTMMFPMSPGWRCGEGGSPCTWSSAHPPVILQSSIVQSSSASGGMQYGTKCADIVSSHR